MSVFKDKLRQTDSWVFITLGVFIYFFTKEFDAVGDFVIFLNAGADLLNESDIYEAYYYNGMQYFYSPFFAVILSWFSFLPVAVVCLLWKLLNVLLFYRLYALLKSFLPSHLNRKDTNRIFLFVFLASLAPVYKSIHLLQFNLVMFWGVMESLKLFNDKKWLLGALILGFFCNVKIIPITVVAYLIYRNEWKGALASIGFSVFFLVVPAVFIGWDYNLSLLQSWFSVMNPSSEGNTVALFVNAEKEFASIPTLIPVWFTDSSYADTNYEIRRHVMDLSPEIVKRMIQGLQVLFVLLNLYFLRSLPFKKEENRLKRLWEVSFLLLSTVLIAPRQQLYSFIYIVPAMTYLSYFFYIKFKNKELSNWRFWLVLLIVTALIINLEFYVGDFREFYYYIKSLGFGALLLVIPLISLKPSYLRRNPL